MDVGGGNGTLLAGILGVTPGPRGIVFDLPHVVERAQAHLAGTGVADRCTTVSGDFFKEVSRGGDAYLLKHVIHDWNDDCAVQILTTCRRAIGPDARLLVIEGTYPERIDTSSESRGAAANNVKTLVCTGGRQCSEAEFHALYAAAGFTLRRMLPTPPLPTRIIEGVPRA
jgi:orsellinic acid C2-O-methyltransferase